MIIVCIFTDTGGYIFGKIFKGPKLTKISPQKTYSGVIGSFLISLLFGLIYIKYFGQKSKLLMETDTIFIILIIIFPFSFFNLNLTHVEIKNKYKSLTNSWSSSDLISRDIFYYNEFSKNNFF